MVNYLISKDSKGKIRCVELSEQWSDELHAFVIQRITYQLHGKKTQQPDLLVAKGKANRTVTEQKNLEFASNKKKYLDKGYKEIDKDPEEYSDEELYEVVGSNVTNTEGIFKPMLAKQEDKVTNRKIFDKEWYASRKIDGCRALVYFRDGEIHTASRGGQNYDAATLLFRKNQQLIDFFEKHPDIILDGELYKHGLSLQQISGAVRLEKDISGLEWIQYYVYDVADPNKIFAERLKDLEMIKKELNLGFDPDKEFTPEDLRIQMVPHEKVSGWSNMEQLHNQYVSEGWEGVVIRDPSKLYRPNGRTNDMIKIKHYQDSTFLVVGYELGLRGSEDMVFNCQLPDGRLFKAKPYGDRLCKQEYVENFEEKYMNQLGDCKFFYYSNDGIPLQPSFIAFRYDLNKSDLGYN
jgi:hypothetical protein